MQQIVTLTGVSTKTGSNDSGGWTLYLFESAGGAKYQTFDDDLGTSATKLINQAAEVEYEVEEREYTDRQGQKRTAQNNTLKSIREAAGSIGDPMQTPGSPAPAPPQAAPSGDDREKRIMRQSGLDRAISTVAAGIVEVEGVGDLFKLSDAYIDYFENGV